MRVRVGRLIASWILISLAASLAGAEEFPYVAYVVEPDTYVRSGPGREHYPTGQLPAGFAVEVYRHDGAGWCAIRPPEGSFSLAPTHQLRLLDARTAEVAASGAVARVGSSLGNQHSAVQVMLERGEPVALLEPPSPTSPWVRIAPPAGEFRWIAARRLSRTPPVESTPAAANAAEWQSHPLTRGAPSGSAAEPTDPAEEETVGEGFGHLHGQTTVAEPAAPEAPVASDEIEIIAGSPADVRQAQYQEPAAADAASATAIAPLTTPPRVRFEGLSASSGPLEPRVAEMQLRLSRIVVGPPATWQLGGLREETAAMLAQEQAAELREQLRDLLDRIATFESVQSRYRALPTMAPLARGGSTTATTAPTAGGAATGEENDVLARARADLGLMGSAADNGVTPTPGGPTPSATEALYDAVGTLKPVVSRRQNAPQYALIDDHGDVVTFVTPSPDVNLQAYVGQRIGVRGSRGFMPEYRRAHVTASRVTTLEQTLVK